MASYTKRIIDIKTVEYSIPCASNGNGIFVAEVCKAITDIKQDAEAMGLDTNYDDWCIVLPSDKEIILTFKVA